MEYKFAVFVLISTIVFSTSEARRPKVSKNDCQKACSLIEDMNGSHSYLALINPFDDECYCYAVDHKTHLIPMRRPTDYFDRFSNGNLLSAKEPMSMVPAGDCVSGIYSPEVVQRGEKELAQLEPEVRSCITRCREHYQLNGGAGICIESKCHCYRLTPPGLRDYLGNWETKTGSKWREFFKQFDEKEGKKNSHGPKEESFLYEHRYFIILVIFLILFLVLY